MLRHLPSIFTTGLYYGKSKPFDIGKFFREPSDKLELFLIWGIHIRGKCKSVTGTLLSVMADSLAWFTIK